jgi:tetratricopeptide (TPR) repeat protein
MAVATRHLGLPEESLYERALAMYEEIGDLEGQSIVLNNLGVRAYFAGKWTESRELYGRSRAAAERAGNVVRGAWATINSAEILLDQGHVGAAAEQFELARRIYAGVGHVFGAAVVTMNFGRIAAREQRFEDAYALLDEARAAFDRIGSAGFVLETDARRAECLVLEGRHREAFDVATATLEHTERVGEVAPRTALLERLRGYAKVQGREPELARPHFDESLRAARDLEAEYELALTMHALAQTGASEYAPLADVVLGRLGVVATPYVPLP